MPHKHRIVRRQAAHRHPLATLPILFGRGGRDRVLLCLALNGPQRIQTIGSAIGSHPSRVIGMVAQLTAQGLTMTARTPGYSYVALNDRSQIHGALRDFLIALGTVWRVPRRQPEYPKLLDWRATNSTEYADVFCSAARSKVLLILAAHDELPLSDARQKSGLPLYHLRKIVAYWEAQGVLASRYVGTEQYVRLDESLPGAQPLRALLREINAFHGPNCSGL